MNRKQKIALWAGIAAFVLLGLFPHPKTLFPHKVKPPFVPVRRNYEKTIDIADVRVQWAIVAVVTGGLIITFKDE